MINELTRKNAHTELDHIFKTILPAHGMTERPEQIRLSHTMLDAMFENRIALSDAGTGIGKTYAYLTAAIVYSHSRLVDGLPFQPVIIATSSIALQNAIVREYLPFLSDALSDDPHITTPILAALRKGKSHYVCDERLRQHLQQRPNGKNVMQKKELYSLRDVLDLDETQKLSSFDRERVCVPQFCDCKHPDCRYRRHLTECGQKRYLFQICNQNLWLADCMHRENGLKPILPDACTVIVDEAHKLPETAREMFGTTLTAGEIRSAVVRLKQDGYALAADRLFSASSMLLQKMAELSPEYHYDRADILRAVCPGRIQDHMGSRYRQNGNYQPDLRRNAEPARRTCPQGLCVPRLVHTGNRRHAGRWQHRIQRGSFYHLLCALGGSNRVLCRCSGCAASDGRSEWKGLCLKRGDRQPLHSRCAGVLRDPDGRKRLDAGAVCFGYVPRQGGQQTDRLQDQQRTDQQDRQHGAV